MSQITDALRREKEYKLVMREAFEESVSRQPLPLLLTGLSDGARSAFYIAAVEDRKAKLGDGKTFIIVPDESAGARVERELSECGIRAAMYPYREFIFNRYTGSHSYEYERLSVLERMLSGELDVVITVPDAALQYTISPQTLKAASFSVSVGGEIDLSVMEARLVALGYVRVDTVDGQGQFSVRGGICDIFSLQYPLPIRIDTFGDEVDRIGFFDVLSQRCIDMADTVRITPARELLLDTEARERIKDAINERLKRVKDEKQKAVLLEELNGITEGTDVSFADKYISVIYPEPATLFDYVERNCLVLVQESTAVNSRSQSFEFRMKEEIEGLLRSGTVSGTYAAYNGWTEDMQSFLASRAVIYCNMFSSGMIERLGGMYNIPSRQTVSYRDNFKLFCEDLHHYIENSYRISIIVENENVGAHLSETLREEEGIKSVIGGDGEVGYPSFVCGPAVSGFELITSKYVCMSMLMGAPISGKLIAQRHQRRSKLSAKERIMSYAELENGDIVVHEKHGIGVYRGLSTLTVGGATSDYLKIEYAGGDSLYLPCTQLDALSKYIGAGVESGLVKLSKMGGTDWVKARTKAKKAAKEMAKELIELYAERLRKKGIAFDEDDEIQREFEAAFPYEETDGQREAIAEIKEDMEREMPMERLLCGDVGYGKTEVALRAAFKAVRSGYQVAILVPTTILALQHFQTMLSRMRGFPVTVDMLSRFRKPKQQAETIRRVKRGEVDILVGTHRILSKDIEFRNLGLVIVDEEQRFGVAQKEKLKRFAKNIDVLTLTATPIPRTLNMAMSGIRDMSILEEPPTDRLPVQTYVLEYDEGLILEAIRNELRRGGQVFYMHNRVEELYSIAAKLSAELEGATVAVAHGQMDKDELSDIWRTMVEGTLDVLVCTTIIEAGIDVPNANTLIIDDADRYGLAQLHQIRGRVGRSGRRAYAYLTYHKGKELSEVSNKRLNTIRDFTEFGSGFRVAMCDLEIRGAGNLLGAEQHGQIDSVGYDMYMKLLNEAILEEKGEGVKKRAECAVALGIDAYIPEKYIRSTSQRIDAYKKIASIRCEEDISDVRDELTDRFGAPPEQTEVLLSIALLRSLGGENGFSRIEYRQGSLLYFTSSYNASVWNELSSEYRGRIFFNAGSSPHVAYRMAPKEDKCVSALGLLKKYIQLSSQNV